MAERVVSVDLGVTWEPNAPAAVLTACDDGTAVLRLSSHPCDEDERDVLLVWSGRRLARMEPPNDEAISGHRLYGAGLSDVLWIGEVIESTLIAQLERMNSAHHRQDPSRYGSLRHWIVRLKECTVEVVGQSLIARRGSAAFVTTTADELAVARILLDIWDVLGVQDLDVHPEHEYLYESARLIDLLRTDVSRTDLIAHLASERQSLTSVSDASSDRVAADALLDWWTNRR